MARSVPELKRKFELLRHHSPYKTPEAIAGKFGVSASTVRVWWTGSWKTNADSVPGRHFPTLVDLFRELLPIAMTSMEVEALLTGSVRAMESALLASDEALLENILMREARRDTGRLHIPKLGLMRHVGSDNEDIPSIRLNEHFYLEFMTGKSGFLLILQNAVQTWGVVAFADGQITPEIKAGHIRIPGIKGKKFIDMYESESTGRHRFVLFISPNPFPHVFAQTVQGGKSLDWSMLCGLARYFENQPLHRREVHLMTIRVV